MKCEVCKHAVHNAMLQKDEAELQNEPDVICNPRTPIGRWLTRFNIEDEANGGISLIDMGAPGKCRLECSRVARACENGNWEADRLVDMVLKHGYSEEKTIAKLCSKACRPHNGTIVVKREWDEPWEAADTKELEMNDRGF